MRKPRRRVAMVAVLAGVGVLTAGCGTARAPGRTPSGVSSATSTPVSTPPTRSATTPPDNFPAYDEATMDLAQAIMGAGDADYADSFGLVSLNRSQHGMSVEMTDLALGRKLVAGARAGHPKWARVPVALVKVPYSMKRLEAAQNLLPDADWKRYQLVGDGIGTCRYLSVESSDPRLKDPSAGRAARARLARTLAHHVGVPVVVTYSAGASAAS